MECKKSYLFGYIESSRTIRMLPIAAERFPQKRVIRFFQALRFLVETGQIPLNDAFHACKCIIFRYCSVNAKYKAYTCLIVHI